MYTSDYHMHTFFSDGKASPEEMAEAARRKGLTFIGITDHSCFPYDVCGIPAERLGAHRAAVAELRRKTEGQIEVRCGIEQDLWSETGTAPYDYCIGSAHFLKLDGAYYAVDGAPETVRAVAEKFFGGDYYALAEEYFRGVTMLIDRVKPDIIGHFDLVSKMNGRLNMFDEHGERYRSIWKPAADALLEWGRPFEINTGAISRGYRTVPYPEPEIAEYLIRRGAKFVLSSDAHTPENIGFGFEKWGGFYAGMGADIIDFRPLAKD